MKELKEKMRGVEYRQVLEISNLKMRALKEDI